MSLIELLSDNRRLKAIASAVLTDDIVHFFVYPTSVGLGRRLPASVRPMVRGIEAASVMMP